MSYDILDPRKAVNLKFQNLQFPSQWLHHIICSIPAANFVYVNGECALLESLLPCVWQVPEQNLDAK